MTEGGWFIGLMSGTSLDGVDGVLVEFSSAGKVKALLATEHLAFERSLHSELAALQSEGPNELHRSALASNALARAYADVVEALVRSTGIDRRLIACIACHGQTVRHRPELGYTYQLNNSALLAELTKVPVVSDFRARDVAAGGQGAPLVPAFHQSLFAKRGDVRLIVNLGGIANVTHLDGDQSVVGYDIGPCNVLLDAWTQQHLGEPFDRNGAWASIGEVDGALLTALLDEPYFDAHPPKSTGRDRFNDRWLAGKLTGFSSLAPEDVQRTLVEFIATLIARETLGVPHPTEVILCGGGTKNTTLFMALEALLKDTGSISLKLTSEYGVDPQHVEAIAFAWLGWCHLNEVPGNVPSATGAADYRILGAYTPE